MSESNEARNARTRAGRSWCDEARLLHSKGGHRCQGSAPSDSEAVRFGAETLKELGLDGARLRVVFGRPVEVPHA